MIVKEIKNFCELLKALSVINLLNLMQLMHLCNLLTNIFLPLLSYKLYCLPLSQIPAFPPSKRYFELPWWLSSEQYACNAEDMELILGLGRSPGGGNGKPLQYSCLQNPMDRGAWQATVMGSQRVEHNWAIEHTHLISNFVLEMIQSYLKGTLGRKSSILFLVSFLSILALFLLIRIISYSLKKKNKQKKNLWSWTNLTLLWLVDNSLFPKSHILNLYRIASGLLVLLPQ